MKTVIAFDLDDTLYDELTYVNSGFKAVAAYLEQTRNFDAGRSFAILWKTLEREGRGKVFDHLLREYGIYSSAGIKKCLSVYRSHRPQINLSEEGTNCLLRMESQHPLYIVTDGNKQVQHNKLEALGLYTKVKHCFVTHRYGVRHAKPSPYCFEKITQMEDCRPEQIIYVGDNPTKDFRGIRPLGFKTVRLRQGQYRDMKVSQEEDADQSILSLDELDESFISRLF